MDNTNNISKFIYESTKCTFCESVIGKVCSDKSNKNEDYCKTIIENYVIDSAKKSLALEKLKCFDSKKRIIAVDFDGTITKTNSFPHCVEPNIELVDALKKAKKNGHILILWTCRNGNYLKDALEYCKSLGLEFDAVNDDAAIVIEEWKENRSKKITSSIYIDDLAITPEEFIFY